MKWIAVLATLLALASCTGPSGVPEQAMREPSPAASTNSFPTLPPPRYASRSIPRSSSGQSVIADYLVVDKSERVLVAYQNGRPIKAYRDLQFGDAPSGHKQFEGDERTPEGIYRIDRRNPQSRFHLSLGISYPNAADTAFAAQYGRSAGGDIFIHGQPTGRPGRMRGDWTDGCIALSNAEIEELWQIVPNGTPIEIRP